MKSAALESTLLRGHLLRYRVRRSRRARRASVQVSRREGVVVVLPWRTPLRRVGALLETLGDWLEAKVAEYDVRLGPRRRAWVDGSPIAVQGVERRLVLEPLPAGRSRPAARLDPDRLTLQLPTADLLDPREALERVLRRWARADLLARTARWADRLGLQPSRVLVGDRTSRWGSCSPSGAVSLCYRLILAPESVADAVVAHEICHLAHLNHGPRFYALLDAACPDHRRAMAWLREHEDDLLL